MTPSPVSSPLVDTELRRPDSWDVLEAAQALSNEVVTGRLVKRLMTIVVEHTGADRGLLVLSRGAEFVLEAIAIASDAGLSVQRVGRKLLPTDLPASMLLRAEESARVASVDDAAAPHEFSQDEYLRDAAPRSALCLPLKTPTEFIGALYVERELFPHAFTPARRQFLEQLSPLIAASLSNAEAYESLRREHAECRHSEAALRRAEERFALTIEASTDGYAEWLADEEVFYASPRLLEQWGISPDLVYTKPHQMLDLFPLHPDDRERVAALLDQHRNGAGRRLEFDTRVVRNDEVRWMHCTILSVRDEAGALSRMSIATSDVTDRIRAQEELRESEERYALALAGTNEGPYDWDLRTNLIYAPPRTQELLGLPVGPVWRTRDEWESQVTHYPGDHERLEIALAAHFAGKTPRYETEVRIVLAGGEIRCFLYRGTVLRDSEGVPYRMVGSLGTSPSASTSRRRWRDWRFA